jgi:hypothetical protein
MPIHFNLTKVSQILVSLPEKLRADYVMVVLLPPKKNTPCPPPSPKVAFQETACKPGCRVATFFRDVATNKSHISSVKRVIKKLLLLAFFYFYFLRTLSRVSKKSGLMTLLLMTVVSENDCWGLVRACSH